MKEALRKELKFYKGLIGEFARRKEYEGHIIVAGRDKKGNFFADTVWDAESLKDDAKRISRVFSERVMLYLVGSDFVKVIPSSSVADYSVELDDKLSSLKGRFVPDMKRIRLFYRKS